MKTTYYIESLVNGIPTIQGYYGQGELSYAKIKLVHSFKADMAQIVCLKGQYFGEGIHAYYMTYFGTDHTNIKFKRHKKSQLKVGL